METELGMEVGEEGEGEEKEEGFLTQKTEAFETTLVDSCHGVTNWAA